MTSLLQQRAATRRVRPPSDTWPFDPDLPQNVPTAALPANWNATADHTPANFAALQALVVDDTNNGTANDWTIIQLTAGVDYEGGLVIDGTCEYILFRSSGFASLPAFESLVTPADIANMATISRAPTDYGHTVLHVSPNTKNIRFIGIQFEATGSGYAGTNYLGPVIVGTINDVTDPSELPDGIGFDRCIITQDDEVNSWHNVFDMQHSFIVGCYFHNLWGGNVDGSTGIRSYQMNHVLLKNIFCESMGAVVFLHDDDGSGATITDVWCEEIYHFRPPEWDDGGVGEHETYGNNKASFESKGVLRLYLGNSVFDGHYNPTFGAVTFKAEGHAGTQEKISAHITIRGVKIKNCAEGINIYAGGSNDTIGAGPAHDILIENVLVEPGPAKAIEAQVYLYNEDNAPPGLGGMSRLQIRKCTLFGTVEANSPTPGVLTGQNHIFRDVILSGEYGYKIDGGGEGADAFNKGWGSLYSATHNLFVSKTAGVYDDDTDPTPLGTLSNNQFPANVAAVEFTDYDGGDYSLDAGSDFLTFSSTGGEVGYDSTTYDSIWAGITP